MFTHTATKGTQAGSFVGFLVGGIIGLARKRSILGTAATFAGYGFASGPLVSIGMTVGRMYGRDKIEWQDRAWRLQRNVNQQTVDSFSGVGMIAGGFLGPVLGLTFLSGCALGTLTGLAGYVGYKSVNNTKDGGNKIK